MLTFLVSLTIGWFLEVGKSAFEDPRVQVCAVILTVAGIVALYIGLQLKHLYKTMEEIYASKGQI